MEQEHFPELEFSPEVAELFTALAKAQGAISTVDRDREVTVKTTTGQSYNYTYATLGQVREACRKPFAESGLSILQFPSYVANPPTVTVITLLGHSSGQWAKARLRLPVAKADAQGIGSAITYARRYTWTAIIGLASEEDDDAQAADAIQGSTQPKGQRNGQKPGNDRGSRREQSVTESRGDRAASGPAAPAQPASAPAPPAAPPSPATAELRNVQKAWHAELREHCGDLSTADRHAFSGVLIGKPVKTETDWKTAHYTEAKRLLGLHMQQCSGSPCALLAKTLGLTPAAAPPTAPAPVTSASVAEAELELERQAWYAEIAAHAADYADPADRAAFASVLLNRQIASGDGWTVKHYSSARKKLAAHAEGCSGEPCPLVAQALGLNPPAAEDAFGGPDPGATHPGTVPAASSDDTALLACSTGDCGKPLTRGQHDVSVRAFGTPLCPTCQRVQARVAA